ncbi:MAG: site-2 protease family protein [Butyricicoccus pullicaecorum]|nr:site-2 protease family protein [Butyricicoccus pullicaecorum]
MLLQPLFRGDMRGFLVTLCLLLPAIIICLTVHECAHGWAARALGDRTAQRAGRLTLDPMAHIDPVGFICMLIFGFGWARPVPVNVSGFRMKNRKLGMALVALAGPASNLLLALICYIITLLLGYKMAGDAMFFRTITMFFSYIASLSVGLGVFNLIPIPPLDGSRVLNAFVPYSVQVKLERYQSVILLAVIFVVYFGLFDFVIMGVERWMIGIAMKLVVPFL